MMMMIPDMADEQFSSSKMCQAALYIGMEGYFYMHIDGYMAHLHIQQIVTMSKLHETKESDSVFFGKLVKFG